MLQILMELLCSFGFRKPSKISKIITNKISISVDIKIIFLFCTKKLRQKRTQNRKKIYFSGI